MLILNKYHKALHFGLPDGRMMRVDSNEIKDVTDEDYETLKTSKFIYKIEVHSKPKKKIKKQ